MNTIEAYEQFRDIINSFNIKNISDITHYLTIAKQIFVAGNGGSYAIASHFAGDLLVNSKITSEIYCLGDNQTAFSAFSNDFSYEKAMAIEYNRRRKETEITVLLFSTSGKSKNIIELAKQAEETGAAIISITGKSPDNSLKKLSNLIITLDSEDAGIVESVYDIITHLLIKELQ